MKRIFLILFFGMLLLLAACAGPSANQPVKEAEGSLDITVYRAPT